MPLTALSSPLHKLNNYIFYLNYIPSRWRLGWLPAHSIRRDGESQSERQQAGDLIVAHSCDCDAFVTDWDGFV